MESQINNDIEINKSRKFFSTLFDKKFKILNVICISINPIIYIIILLVSILFITGAWYPNNKMFPFEYEPNNYDNSTDLYIDGINVDYYMNKLIYNIPSQIIVVCVSSGLLFIEIISFILIPLRYFNATYGVLKYKKTSKYATKQIFITLSIFYFGISQIITSIVGIILHYILWEKFAWTYFTYCFSKFFLVRVILLLVFILITPISICLSIIGLIMLCIYKLTQ